MKEEINNSLDYLMSSFPDYLADPMILSLWVDCKMFLGAPINDTTKHDIISYFDSKQQSDGSWGTMFDTNRVLLAYWELNATPATSLETFFSNYVTWQEAKDFMLTHGSGDARDMYHLIFAWIAYYHTYPSWLDDFFDYTESNLSWTNSWDFHKRTHILYSYVVARRPFPNLDGITNTTLAEQESDGHWDGSMYPFYSDHGDVYFTSIQISLLGEILGLYRGYRTAEIQASLDLAKTWVNGSYNTQTVNGKVCGYFGSILNLEHGIFEGILCASQTGLISSNVDMTFQNLVDIVIAPNARFEYSPEKPIVYEQIAFNGSASSSNTSNITSFEWNFGDGNITATIVPTINHAYTLPENYTLTLRVTDNNNLSGMITKTITVYSERIYTFNVSWQELNYTIIAASNSTVTNFNFNYSLKQISYYVTGSLSTIGYCNVSIPKTFIWCDWPSQWNVSVDGSLINDLKVAEDTNTSLFFTYNHSTHEVVITGIHVVPEFPSASILVLFMAIVLICVVSAKKMRARGQKEGKIV
jgi:PKD repeat protein